jgi:hypothetical protein
VARLCRLCDRPNVYLLDLAPALAAQYAKDGRRFDFTFDDHWNAHGHDVLGTALADFLRREHIVKERDEADAPVVQNQEAR